MSNRLNLEKSYYLTCSLRETSIQENINCIRNAIYDGAEAFMFHMEKVQDEQLTLDNLKLLYAYAGDRPIISVNYRSRHKPGKSDEDIIKQQIMSIEAGADCVDMFGDIYNPSVNEIAMDEETINKQKQLIKTYHDLGAKVLISSHIYRYMNKDEVVNQMKLMQDRGADIAKIAMSVTSKQEAIEATKTTLDLNNELQIPFFHVCMGQYGKVHRSLAGFLGSKIVLCVQEYNINSNPMEQPLLKAIKQVYENVDSSMARDIMLGAIK